MVGGIKWTFKMTVSAAALVAASCLVTANAQEGDGIDEQATMEAVVVNGRRVSTVDLAIGVGEATNTVAVTREELLSAPSGISGLKMLETLP